MVTDKCMPRSFRKALRTHLPEARVLFEHTDRFSGKTARESGRRFVAEKAKAVPGQAYRLHESVEVI